MQLVPPSKESLYLIANHTVFQYLCDYDGLETLGLQSGSSNPVVWIPADAIHWPKSSPSEGSNRNGSRSWYTTPHADLCASLGLRSLQTVDVEHRTLCHGLIIKHIDDWSIVYSGDTVPVHRLVQAGQNATLLIHEATMADDEADKARAKMHSTVGQAIDIGKKMNAYGTLLTHFSARYPTMPQSMLTSYEPGEPIVALAFDHANVRIGDMRKMQAYMPAIEQSFTELDDDDDATAQVAEVDIT
ncbi:beta-lactamase-like protein [Pisolithus marmoratus]|nr:beta-lactamase-like protein [Pisolithus marmoratus]